MSEEKPADGEPHIPTRGVSRPPTPKAIAAQSQAWIGKARTIILGGSLLALFILIGIAMFVRPEMAKDLLWAVIAIAAYLAGSSVESSRKDDK
jgi:hypothetical protein